MKENVNLEKKIKVMKILFKISLLVPIIFVLLYAIYSYFEGFCFFSCTYGKEGFINGLIWGIISLVFPATPVFLLTITCIGFWIYYACFKFKLNKNEKSKNEN